MGAQDELAERFEASRGNLQAIAYRMLGSFSDAEDAVQETWLRLTRAGDGVQNLDGWLRTVISRICLDMLRSRASRQEEPAGDHLPDGEAGPGPEQETILANSVGNALLVMLDRLGPDERAAFVLHDMFSVPFNEIGPIVGRSTATAKKLASRARQKVHRPPAADGAVLAANRRVVEMFLAATRAGDVEGVLAVLAPDVVRRADPAALQPGRAAEVRGARAVAEEIAIFGANARFAEPVLVNGAVGFLVAPRGRLLLAATVTIEGEKISSYELIADTAQLARLDLAVLGR